MKNTHGGPGQPLPRPEWDRAVLYGGQSQLVYHGSSPKAYQFTCEEPITGLWVRLDGNPANDVAIPTDGTGNAVGTGGSHIEVVNKGEHPRIALWADLNPTHLMIRPGRDGVQSAPLSHVGDSIRVHNDANVHAVFRFTGGDEPTGLWVVTQDGTRLPIPSFSNLTSIDVGGTTLTIVSDTDQYRTVFWQDISA